MNGADSSAAILRELDVQCVFGLPGTQNVRCTRRCDARGLRRVVPVGRGRGRLHGDGLRARMRTGRCADDDSGTRVSSMRCPASSRRGTILRRCSGSRCARRTRPRISSCSASTRPPWPGRRSSVVSMSNASTSLHGTVARPCLRRATGSPDRCWSRSRCAMLVQDVVADADAPARHCVTQTGRRMRPLIDRLSRSRYPVDLRGAGRARRGAAGPSPGAAVACAGALHEQRPRRAAGHRSTRVRAGLLDRPGRCRSRPDRARRSRAGARLQVHAQRQRRRTPALPPDKLVRVDSFARRARRQLPGGSSRSLRASRMSFGHRRDGAGAAVNGLTTNFDRCGRDCRRSASRRST